MTTRAPKGHTTINGNVYKVYSVDDLSGGHKCTKSLKRVPTYLVQRVGVRDAKGNVTIACPECGAELQLEWQTQVLDSYSYPYHERADTCNSSPSPSSTSTTSYAQLFGLEEQPSALPSVQDTQPPPF